ncbi:hypothetical protein [Bacteroides xylanisolvens]|uniref:hypothetical protein n=1 Tax=Bacteroides xylanisolvens TaxID=371601 RepID=UPI0039B519D9
MKIPPIDLTNVLKLLKSEGKNEVAPIITKRNPFIEPSFINEWNNILRVLELELIPTLKKGGEVSILLPTAKKLSKSAANLSLTASQILSFVPGPIGIVCSIINAIVCFCSGNIPGGLLELIGCIPGAKMGVKGSSKVAEKVGAMILDILKKNPNFIQTLCAIRTFGSNFNVSKVKKIIKDIDSHSGSANRKLDTGCTYNLNFDHLNAQPFASKRINNPSFGLERKGISNYRLGYRINPQTTIWPK